MWMADHSGDADAPMSPPRDLPVSTAHPELRYRLDADAPASAPVYRRVPSGETVVPTGRVLVRFGEGDKATDHEDDLRAAGYVVDEVLSYAPNAAWVRADGGSIADALHSLEDLSKAPGIEAWEPEMIGPSAKRD